tara:strand:+ start:384 stop:590 length:207 start_codon:yes stop_codon:yes gene_type:complete
MSLTEYNFKRPKINRLELEMLNWFLTYTDDNPLINEKSKEVFLEHGYTARDFQDLLNKIKSIIRTYRS